MIPFGSIFIYLLGYRFEQFEALGGPIKLYCSICLRFLNRITALMFGMFIPPKRKLLGLILSCVKTSYCEIIVATESFNRQEAKNLPGLAEYLVGHMVYNEEEYVHTMRFFHRQTGAN